MSTIRSRFTIDGVLADITSIFLSDPTGTFGVKRNDTDAVVVVDGTAMDKVSTGIYEYTFDDPAYDLEYTYWIEWTYAGETHREEHTLSGPESSFTISVTSSELYARIRRITQRTNETDYPNATIDTRIQEAVREITRRKMPLKSSTTGTLSADDNTITKPSDMIDSCAAIDNLYLDSELLFPITFAEWRAGYRTGYAYRDGVIYVNPTPNSDKSYTLYYRKEHSASVTTLELSDEYKLPVMYLACSLILEEFEQEERANLWENKAEAKLNKLISTAPIIGVYRRE